MPKEFKRQYGSSYHFHLLPSEKTINDLLRKKKMIENHDILKRISKPK
jgi:hypothetical protein